MRAQRVFTRGGLAGLVRGAQVARRSREVDLVLELEGRLALVLARGAEGVAGGGAAAQALDAQSGGGDVCSVGLGEESSQASLGSSLVGGDAREGTGAIRTLVPLREQTLSLGSESASRAGGVVNTAPSTTFGEAARGSTHDPRGSAERGVRTGVFEGARALARRGTHARVARVHFARSRGAGAHGKSPDGGECGPRIALSTREGGNTSLALDATSGPRFCSEMLTVYNSRNVPGRLDTWHARDDVDLLLSRHEKRFFSTTTKKAPDRCGQDHFHARPLEAHARYLVRSARLAPLNGVWVHRWSLGTRCAPAPRGATPFSLFRRIAAANRRTVV